MYMGIDIGTSGIKTVIADESQSIIEETSVPLSVSRPHPKWSEQDPCDWWEATQKAVKKLSAKSRSAVKAIGLSGQMHGATCLDANNKIIRPAILWNDGRSTKACQKMMADLPSLMSITGNLAMAGFTAPKIHWMRAHEPENFTRIAKVLLPKDYIRFLMSGEYASDMSDSAGTLWLNVAGRHWSDEALELTGLSQDHMPNLFEGSEVTGQLLPSIAKDWGMSQVPIAAGGGDNAAGAIGSGTVVSGKGFISLGTSGVVFLTDEHYQSNTDGAVHSFCHALPNLWHRMGVILSAASAIDFVSRVTGYERPAKLYEAVEAASQPSNGPIFLPYLSGERTPHNNANATGAFFGLTHEDTPASMAQAALEGVAFALADCIDVLKSEDAPIEELSVIGGGARSSWWGEVISSALNIPLTYRKAGAVGPAFGAARLARLCLNQDKVEDICTPPPITHIIEPNAKLRDLYSGRRDSFKKLYHATKNMDEMG